MTSLLKCLLFIYFLIYSFIKMSRTARILDDCLDKSFLYSILLNQASSHYGRVKTLLKIPIILTSSVMSVVNGNLDNSESLKNFNITFNLLTAIVLGMTATFNIEQKFQNFLQAQRKFLILFSKIEQKILDENDIIRTEFVNEIMNEYDMIVESIDFDVPSYICKHVRAQYATKKTLPLVINGIRKEECNRSPQLSNLKTDRYFTMKPIVKPLMSSILFDDNTKINSLNKFESSYNTPRVLEIKPLEVIVEGLQE